MSRNPQDAPLPAAKFEPAATATVELTEIPTLRVARAPARAGTRATGAPIQVHRGKSDMDTAGWLPTAEGA